MNPVEEVDVKRMLPAGYQDWCDRVLEDDEIVELRNRFQVIRSTWNSMPGPRRGNIARRDSART
ncbi:hypothetical protein [Paraburkholderia dipogonis]|nr:hypothetical protein [Paraburkholderia dipogonis]